MNINSKYVIWALYILIFISASLFGYSTLGKFTASGHAIYLTQEGLQVTDPQEPLPSDIANINIMLWGSVAFFFLALVVYTHIVSHKTKHH